MKKVICAAAAFAMVAGIATVASAEVKLSGDARARLIYNDSGLPGSESQDKLDSRVRVVFQGMNEGGGYIKARLRFLDGTWGQGAEYTPLAKGDGNVWSDYAFLGFKKGNVDVAAGKMPLGFSKWFLDDERADRFRVRWNFAEGSFAAVTYDKKIYGDGFVKPAVAVVDGVVVPGYVASNLDGDKDVWGITYKGKLTDTFTTKVRAVYVADDSGADKDGFKGSAQFAFNLAGNNLITEWSLKEGDTVAVGADDQWGFYAEWNATYDTFTPTVRAGYTADGFSADESFGWLMIGGDEPISRITRLGMTGDTTFIGASAKMAPTEMWDFQGNAVYLDVDDGILYGDNPFELSAQANYYLSKGVTLTGKAGYLFNDSDAADADDAFGAYGRMEVEF